MEEEEKDMPRGNKANIHNNNLVQQGQVKYQMDVTVITIQFRDANLF